ncbi:MAG: nucleotidyltransferase family protein [Arenicella sp.]
MVKNWQKSVISLSSVLRDALENLNANNRGIVFIADDGHLCGTITDGDVRRALLAGVDTNDSVEKVLNKQFISCHESDTFESAKEQMLAHSVQALPVLNATGFLVGVHFLDEADLISRPNQALIMAGGLGSRLRPLTNDCPKPMLEIDGKPMLERIIENLKSQGFLDIYISINYLGDKIRGYFGSGEGFGVAIHYLEESDKLGTAGALGLLPDNLTQPIIVLNGDVLTKADYVSLVDYHVDNGAALTIGLNKQETIIPYGVVQLENEKVLSIQEKPTHSYYISAGIYCISPSVFSGVTGADYLDMPDLISQKIHEKQSVIGFPLHEYWADIGMASDYSNANSTFKEVFDT